ncbi:MAG: hypothetical protein GX221_07045 [Candidatus Riflebacteria bacterium]|nr:hypothetical protein [Candidatus Riflebacteria bacterium]
MSLKKHFKTLFLSLCLILAAILPSFAGTTRIYFGPLGGFATINNARTLVLQNGERLPATLSNSIIHKFDSLKEGSLAKIAMYSMSDFVALDAMIDAAYKKNVEVRLLLDNVTTWANESVARIVTRVAEAKEKAEAEGVDFKFIIAGVSKDLMIRNGRSYLLDDGTLIVGTMHEKFGIFYEPGTKVPFDSFSGSANISVTSDQIYGENRVFFEDQPAVARQLAEEFARLWNEYGEPLLGEKKPEKYIEASPVPGYASIYFNSEPENELSQTRLDSKIMELISRTETSLDLGMFSFTRPELAQALLAQAKRYPEAKFRILLDHAQMHDENPDESKLAPWLESEAERLGIENIEIRYRFRKNAYSYNPETGKTELLSYLSKFWHHKNITVNDSEMIVGSYNWSNSAEYINYENLVFFNGAFEGHADVIRRFKAEFDALFEASEGRKNSKGVYCRTVTLKEGRAEFKKISEALKLDDAYKAQSALGRNAVKDFDTLLQETGMSRKKLQKVLAGLVRAGILTRTETDGKTLYKQAD